MNVSHLAIGMLNATWQSVALICAAAVGLRLCRKVSAPIRCALWSCVFFLSALLPIADLALQHTLVVSPPRPAAVEYRAAYVFDRTATDAARPRRREALPSQEPVVVRVAQPVSAPPAPANPVVAPARAWQAVGGVVLALYVLGATCFLIRLGVESLALLRLKRRARELEGDAFGIGALPRRARLATSSDVSIPCVLGLGRPTIVLPEDMPGELSANDLRRVVAHESAHLERYDDWTNLFEQIVLAAFFYNPAMHFAARQIATEREIACDDRVVMGEGETLTYAECLASLVRRAAAPSRIPAPGLYAGPRQIVVRMERLLDRAYVRSRRLGSGIVVTAGAVLALAVAVVGFDVPVIADTIPAPAPPTMVKIATVVQKRVAAAAFVEPRASQKHVASTASVVALVQPKRSSDAAVAAATAPPAPPALATAEPASPPSAPAPSTAPMPAIAPMPATPAMPAMPPMREDLPMHFAPMVMPPLPKMPRAPRIWIVSNGSVEVVRTWGRGGSMLDALAAAGYPRLSVGDLIRLADSGVTAGSILEFGKLFGHPSVDQLKRLSDAGVTPNYVEHLRDAGLSNLSIDDAVALANAGVSSSEVERYFRALASPPSVKDIIRLHNSGVH